MHGLDRKAQWSDVFSGLGKAKGFSHFPMIDQTVTPVQQSLRRLPLALRDEVSKELKRMLDEGIIEQIDTSRWLSNVVVVRKKSGDIRLCFDLRQVNKGVIPDKYPIPTLEELMSEFCKSTVFSKLDLFQGYLQIPLDERCRNLTAFVTHAGVFQFCRVPFGLASAPNAFQKIMRQVFDGLEGVTIYLDDIVVHGSCQEEHDSRLQEVLQRLADYHLTLNSQKCIFGQKEIEFLGYVVAAGGLRPIHSKVEAIHRIPKPNNVEELASFLGVVARLLFTISLWLCGYDGTVETITEEGSVWTWTSACDAAFEELKRRLTSPPVLAHFQRRINVCYV